MLYKTRPICCYYIVIALFFTAIIMSCSNKNKGESSGAYEYEKNSNLKEKSLKVGDLFINESKDSLITYSSLKEAEQKLVSYFFPDGNGIQKMDYKTFRFDYDLFQTMVMTDTSSMNYPFDSLRHYAGIDILDSKDRQVRFYVWEPPHGWRGSAARTLVQYRSGSKIQCQTSLYWDWTGSSPMKLWTIHVNGNNYYMTADYFFYGGEDFIGYSMYKLTDKGLVELAGHDSGSKESGREHAVSYELYPGDWYSRTGGMGYDWLDYYDEATNTLYVPDEDVFLNDRYLRYRWNGKELQKVGDESVANPYLHPSLKEYEGLVFLKVSERNIIRIDKMNGGRYRYAAWASKDKIGSKPELVITNGTKDEKTEQYIFHNNEYEYRVGTYKITILKNGKKVGEYMFNN